MKTTFGIQPMFMNNELRTLCNKLEENCEYGYIEDISILEDYECLDYLDEIKKLVCIIVEHYSNRNEIKSDKLISFADNFLSLGLPFNEIDVEYNKYIKTIKL